MERKGEATKHQLAESFKELMLKGSFDKITIRMITEQAGVIRPTFYNYFQDKYEVMEWLLEEEVFRPVFDVPSDSGCGRTGGGLYRAGTDRGLTV